MIQFVLFASIGSSLTKTHEEDPAANNNIIGGSTHNAELNLVAVRNAVDGGGAGRKAGTQDSLVGRAAAGEILSAGANGCEARGITNGRSRRCNGNPMAGEAGGISERDGQMLL